ncbi:hypothetical protein ACFLR1_03625 [Bacteroidota bacterium]
MNRLISILLLVFVSAFGLAQNKKVFKERWRNSVGASVHFLETSGGRVSPAFGVFYNPQVNVLDKYSNFSLAVTMPLTVGAHVKTTFLEKTFFYGHVPAVLEANFGHYSTRDFRSDIGIGAGAGYGVQINDRGLSSGFEATLAARTRIANGSITIRYSFHLNLQGRGYNSHNIALAVNLGSYFKKLYKMNKLTKWHDFK